MSAKFKNVKDIIEKENEFANFRKAVKEQDIIGKFGEVFPTFKEIAVPVRLTNGVLFIKVENSVWRSELNLKKELMISKINSFFNEEDLIKNIKFI